MVPFLVEQLKGACKGSQERSKMASRLLAALLTTTAMLCRDADLRLAELSKLLGCVLPFLETRQSEAVQVRNASFGRGFFSRCHCKVRQIFVFLVCFVLLRMLTCASKGMARKCFEAAATVDPDLVWYCLMRAGGRDGLTPPDPDLASVRFPPGSQSLHQNVTRLLSMLL